MIKRVEANPYPRPVRIAMNLEERLLGSLGLITLKNSSGLMQVQIPAIKDVQ